jgi:TonB family protein
MVSVKPTLQANLPESVSSGHRGIVALRFRVLKDGTIQNDVATIEKSSGRGDMDEAAVAAIRTAAPCSPLPEAYPGRGMELRFLVFYNIKPAAKHE